MTTFPDPFADINRMAGLEPDPPTVYVKPPKPIRAAIVDGAVRRSRATTPPDVAEKRQPKRLSIEEINNSDLPSLQQRYRTTQYDTRGPVTRFLDLIDLPRNEIAGMLARFTGRDVMSEHAAAGETGAFGRGKVYFSDVLDNLGVKNQIIKGVVGFAGDVLTDPLTYVGPGLFKAARLSGSTGTVTELTREGRRTIDAGIRAVANGREAAHPAVRTLLQTFGEDVGAMRAAGKAPDEIVSHLSSNLYGDIANRTRDLVLRKAGAALHGKGGLLADATATDLTEAVPALLRDRVLAARKVVAEMSRSAGGGVRIGRRASTGRLGVEVSGQGAGDIAAGSAVAHIPFTSYALYLPAFTGGAEAGVSIGNIARQAGVYAGKADEPATAGTQAMAVYARQASAASNGIRDAAERLPKARELAEADAQAVFQTPDALHPTTGENAATYTDRLRRDIEDSSRIAVQQHSDALDLTLESMRAAMRDAIQTGQLTDPTNAIHQVALLQAAKADADAARSQLRLTAFDKAKVDEVRTAFKSELADETARELDNTFPQRKTPGFDPTKASREIDRMREDQIAGRVREAKLSRMDDDVRKWIDPTDDELASRARIAEALHKETDALQMYADATRGSLDEATKLKGNLSHVAEIALRGIGLDHSVLGSGLFSSLATQVRSMMGDDSMAGQIGSGVLLNAAAGARKTFGQPEGAMRMVKRLGMMVADPRHIGVQNRVLAEFARDLHKLDIPAADADLALAVVTAKAILKREAENPGTWKIGPALHAKLEEAVARGMGKHSAALEEMAAKYTGILDDIEDAEVSDKLLRSPREAYIAQGLTPEGQRSARGSRGLGGFIDTAGAAKRKSTAIADWLDPATQEPRSLARFEYEIAKAHTQKDIENIADEGQRAFVERVKDLQEQYDALPVETKLAATFKQVDPFTLNQMVRNEGRFAQLTQGAAMPRGLFEENAALNLANRIMQHERATTGQYIVEYLSDLGRQFDSTEISQAMQRAGGKSTEFRTPTGVIGRVERIGQGADDWRVTIGPVRYRRLKDPDSIRRSVDFLGNPQAAAPFTTTFFPEQAAEVIESVFRTIDQPGRVIDAYDKILSTWKSLTLLHPSWTAGNMLGGTIQALATGATPQSLARAFPLAIKILMRSTDEAGLRALKATIGGQVVDGLTLANNATRDRVLHSLYTDAAMEALHGNFNVRVGEPRLRDVLRGKTGIRELASGVNKTAELNAQTWAQGSKLAGVPLAKQAAKLKNVVWDQGYVKRILAPWYAANQRAEQAIRLATYIALQDGGTDAVTAGQQVVKHLFDFGDMTHTESAVFKRLVPFFNWVKNSSVWATRMMFEQPQWIAAVPKAKQALEQAIDGDQQLPDHLRPSWMRDQLAIQIGKDADTRTAFTVGTLLPQEGALHAGGALAGGGPGLQDLLQYFAFGLSPVAKVPIELAQGRELYSQREISFKPDQGDLSAGEYLTNQIRPFRELGLGNIRQGPLQKAASGGLGPLALRAALGGRAQPFGDERVRQNRLREFKDAEDKIRKRITIAEREGAKEASLSARARLLKLYENAEKTGLGDAVPRWAKRMLPTLTS